MRPSSTRPARRRRPHYLTIPFLLSQAIENALKSNLLIRGVTEHEWAGTALKPLITEFSGQRSPAVLLGVGGVIKDLSPECVDNPVDNSRFFKSNQWLYPLRIF